MKKALYIIACLLLLAIFGLSSCSQGLYIPSFGQGYVITDKETEEVYQLRGQESFEIDYSTIRFIPLGYDEIISLNGRWTLEPGMLRDGEIFGIRDD